jgi:hypothetical protein
LLLSAFSLPWITVSCDAAETEQLTGMELVSGKEPEIYGPADGEGRDDILEAVSGQQNAATVLFGVVVASLLAALVAVVSGIPRSARVATILTVMSALGFVAFLFSSFEIFGADTHHLYGYFVATTTSVIAAIDAVWLGIATRSGNPTSLSGSGERGHGRRGRHRPHVGGYVYRGWSGGLCGHRAVLPCLALQRMADPDRSVRARSHRAHHQRVAACRWRRCAVEWRIAAARGAAGGSGWAT